MAHRLLGVLFALVLAWVHPWKAYAVLVFAVSVLGVDFAFPHAPTPFIFEQTPMPQISLSLHGGGSLGLSGLLSHGLVCRRVADSAYGLEWLDWPASRGGDRRGCLPLLLDTGNPAGSDNMCTCRCCLPLLLDTPLAVMACALAR